MAVTTAHLWQTDNTSTTSISTVWLTTTQYIYVTLPFILLLLGWQVRDLIRLTYVDDCNASIYRLQKETFNKRNFLDDQIAGNTFIIPFSDRLPQWSTRWLATRWSSQTFIIIDWLIDWFITRSTDRGTGALIDALTMIMVYTFAYDFLTNHATS